MVEAKAILGGLLAVLLGLGPGPLLAATLMLPPMFLADHNASALLASSLWSPMLASTSCVQILPFQEQLLKNEARRVVSEEGQHFIHGLLGF